MSNNNTRAIQQSFTIAAPPEKVFQALTDSRELTRWWMTKSISAPQAGGQFEYVWEFEDPSRNGRQAGAYLEVTANRTLRYPWEAGNEGQGHNTVVEFTLNNVDGGTQLELNHTGYKTGGEWEQVYEMTAQAWGFFLGNLKAYLEDGQDNRAAALGQKVAQPK